jgi:hypothetical protein
MVSVPVDRISIMINSFTSKKNFSWKNQLLLQMKILIQKNIKRRLSILILIAFIIPSFNQPAAKRTKQNQIRKEKHEGENGKIVQ